MLPPLVDAASSVTFEIGVTCHCEPWAQPDVTNRQVQMGCFVAFASRNEKLGRERPEARRVQRAPPEALLRRDRLFHPPNGFYQRCPRAAEIQADVRTLRRAKRYAVAEANAVGFEMGRRILHAERRHVEPE